MKIKQINPFLKLLGLVGVVVTMNACSSDPAPWTKSDSPWDQRRGTEAEAPAADSYKADLEMPADSATEVELSYEADTVESFTPEAAVEPEETSYAVEEESSAETGSIMGKPANYYTMQLMASVDIDRVIRFAEENQISTQYVVATERNGVVWHVLLLDIYPDYSTAVAARDEISPSLRNAPWIRTVGSVQKLVR